MDRKYFLSSFLFHMGIFLMIFLFSLYTPRSTRKIIQNVAIRGFIQQNQNKPGKPPVSQKTENTSSLQPKEEVKKKDPPQADPTKQHSNKDTRNILESKKKKAAIEKKIKKNDTSVKKNIKQENIQKKKEQTVENALKELEKAEEKQRTQSVENFLTELSELPSGSGGTSTGDGISSYEEYTDIVKEIIRSQWSFHKLGQTENLLTVVRIYIDAQGKILRYEIEQSSGRKDYDAAAIQSIKEFTHFPPPPEGKGLDFVVNFNLLEE